MVFTKPIAPFLVIFCLLFGVSSQTRAAAYRTVGLGIMSWPEVVQISDNSGRSFDATAQFYTPSVHYGYRNYRAADGFLYEGYLLYGSADIQSTSGVTYFQKRVPMYGAGAAVGWFLRPQGKQVNIGVSLPVQFRHANWTSPPGGGDVSKKDLFAVGAVLDARWRMTEHIAINQRVGGFLGHKSALWMINLEWTL